MLNEVVIVYLAFVVFALLSIKDTFKNT